MKTFERVFIVPDFMITMLMIDDNKGLDMTSLHYKSKITYSHLHLIKKFLIHKDWIYIEKQDRSHIPHLTEKGLDVLKNIITLLDSMGISKQDAYDFKLKEKRDVVHIPENINEGE